MVVPMDSAMDTGSARPDPTADFSEFWKVVSYERRHDDPDSLSWTEYAVEDRSGNPICTGIPTEKIAERIALLPLNEQLASQHLETLAHQAKTKRNDGALYLEREGTNQLLAELLAEVKHLRASIGSSSRSSAELTENAKGGVQITTKVYEGSSVDDVCVDVVAAFRTLKAEVERGQMEQWKSTVEQMLRERES